MQRKIIIIGTVHDMLPKYKRELTSLLEKMNPDQVLVEIMQKNIDRGFFRKYPREMVHAYRWAQKRKIQVNGFDSPIEIVKNTSTNAEIREVVHKITKAIGHDWKSYNKLNSYKHAAPFFFQIIDKKKHTERQKEMLANVRKLLSRKGIVLMLTGAFHLPFFEKHLKGAYVHSLKYGS